VKQNMLPVIFRAANPRSPTQLHIRFGGHQHPEEWGHEVAPDPRPLPARTAEANERAGFMLMPDRSASSVM
jgi:hypothetical protein